MFLIITFITLLLYLIWLFGTRNFDYWKKKGVTHPKPVFFFGNMYKPFMGRISFCQQIMEWYDDYPEEPYVGVHVANDVALVVRDPGLIKRILVTDFQYFPYRGFSHKTTEKLIRNLFTADGDIWKLMRQRLTPVFTGVKLKAMFPLIQRTTEKMLQLIQPGIHDVKELAVRYTSDIIGACGFGIDFDTLRDESSILRRVGKRLTTFTVRDALVHFAKSIAPELFKRFAFFAAELDEDMTYLVKQTLEKRNYAQSGRNDFIDFLLELKQKGNMVGQSMEHFNADGTAKRIELELDESLIVAQAFVFFGAGFETSSSAASFVLHELAFAPDIQERCHEEVDAVLSRHNGKISYEAVKEMEYLEMVIKETLRIHTSPGYLIRKCGKRYTIPGSSLTIDKGVTVLIPLQSLHTDHKYFDDPETFRPERFDSAQVKNAGRNLHFPFGEGPRACIGERLGMIETLSCVAALLSRFRVEPAPTTRRRPIIDPRSFFAENVLGGLPLNLVVRESAH